MPSVSKSQRIHSQQKLCQVRAKCRAWTTASIGNSKSAKQKGQRSLCKSWPHIAGTDESILQNSTDSRSIQDSQTLEPLMGVFFLHKGSHQEKSSRKEDISATPPPRQRSRSRQSVCNLVSDTPRPKLNETKIDASVTSSDLSGVNMKAELATAELRSQRWCSVTVSGKLKFSGKPCKRRSSRLVKYLNTRWTRWSCPKGCESWRFFVFWSHIRQNCSWALKFGRSKTNFCPASHLLQASQVVALDHLIMHEAAHPQDHLAKTGSSYLTVGVLVVDFSINKYFQGTTWL